MISKFALVALVVAASATSVSAQAKKPSGGSGVAVAHGKCIKLSVRGETLPACKGEVASLTLAGGKIMFVFTAKGNAVAFQGEGQALKPKGDAMVLPISFASVGVDGKTPGVTPATGSCVFGNPYLGKPAKVDCSAKSQFGEISGSFLTDGKPPKAQ
jgi:hypothetical protein